MDTALVRVLVVEDSETWRRFFSVTLQKRPDVCVISEACDGLEAVQQAQQLQPDLILLDIGLPTLNGIEAARQIRKASSASKILFVSENRYVDVVDEALRTGAGGYVLKSDAGRDLLPAVDAVLDGKRFVSASLGALDLAEAVAEQRNTPQRKGVVTPFPSQKKIGHEVAFYADDGSVVDGYARFIESALTGGNVVIVVVTEAHRASLLPRLEADGVNVPAAIEQGSYIPLDAADTLSRLTIDDTPDPVRCAKVIGDLIMGAAKGVKAKHGRVVVCGEIAPELLFKGNPDGAIQLEHLWDEITRGYGVDTLCGYLWNPSMGKEGPIFERICAEHSAVHGLGY